MQKWIRAVLITLLILAFLPAAFGLLAKRALHHLLENLVLPQGMSLSLEDYTYGWLSSYAAINIHMANAAPEYASDKAIDILVHGNIKHGPLLPTQSGVGLGIGLVDLHADLKDIHGLVPEVQAALQQMFSDAHLLYASSYFHLNRAITVDVKSSPMNASANGDTIQWNGIHAHIKINNAFDQLHTEATITPLLFSTAQGGMLDSAPIHFVAQLEREDKKPWMGEQLLSIPAFYLKDEMGSVLRFDHLRMTSNSSAIDNLLQASLRLEAKNIEIANQIIEQLHFDLDLDNIATEPLMRLSKMMAKNQVLSPRDTQIVFHDLINTLAQGANIKLDYILNLKNESMTVHALLEFADIHDTLSDSLVTNSQQLLAGLNGRVEVLAPQQFVKDILLQQMQSPDMQLDQLTSQVEGYLAALAQQGILSAQDQTYHFQLDYQQGKILLNGTALTQDEIFLLLMLLSQAVPHASIAP